VNHDALKPGNYPVRIQVVGPKVSRQLDTTIQLEISKPGDNEAPFARSVFSHDLVVDGPPGRYKFLATFERGAAAGGGEAEFYVGDTAGMPEVAAEIVMWGGNEKLAAWLKNRNLRFRDSLAPTQTTRELILACGKPPETAEAFSELARRIVRGSTVVFLMPEILLDAPFTRHPVPLRWVPIGSKVRPQLAHTEDWYFHADPWGKEHPVFAGLPSGGILDYTLYRDIISFTVFRGLESSVEAISGTIQTSGGPDDYQSDLTVAAYKFGAGRVILNSLKIQQNLGTIPTAERLLRNLLNYASQGIEEPIAVLSPGFDDQLPRLFT
jgi:hypothetical protein